MASSVSKELDLPDSARSVLREVLRAGSANALIRQGYTYLQIVESLSALIGSGLVLEENGRLSLTAQGKKALLSARNDKSGFFWLDPRDDARVAKIGLMTPYIPERRSLQGIKHRTSS